MDVKNFWTLNSMLNLLGVAPVVLSYGVETVTLKQLFSLLFELSLNLCISEFFLGPVNTNHSFNLQIRHGVLLRRFNRIRMFLDVLSHLLSTFFCLLFNIFHLIHQSLLLKFQKFLLLLLLGLDHISIVATVSPNHLASFMSF